MFEGKRTERLEARVCKLEREIHVRGPERDIYGFAGKHKSHWYYLTQTEALQMVIDHLGLQYEPEKKSGPALVKKERTRPR